MQGEKLEDHFAFHAGIAYELMCSDSNTSIQLADVFAGILFSVARDCGYYRTTAQLDSQVIDKLRALGYRVSVIQLFPVELHQIAWNT